MKKRSFATMGHGSKKELAARKRLLDLFSERPIPDDELLVNLGLYTRSLILAKILYLNELYQRILPIPGIVVEFGVWWGSNLALLNSLRSIYEPYNFARKVVGFDTFEGYQSHSPKDGASSHLKYTAEGGYAVGSSHQDYLEAILQAHEEDNVLAQIRKHELVKGNVVETAGAYLKKHPETIISLAYFDLGLYEPTRKCLEAIRPHLVRGSILAMDELNSSDFPGETLAVSEVVGLDKYKMFRSQFLPDRSYIVID